MYRKDKCLSLKSSLSAIGNNLSIHLDKSKSMLYYAVVSKVVVNILHTSMDGRTIGQRQIIYREPGSQFAVPVVQVRIVSFPTQAIVVITGCSGIQMCDLETTELIFWYGFQGDNYASDCFARGICGLQEDTICVGMSTGDILLFDIPSRGSNITLTETLTGHSSGIWDLHSDGDRLVSGDDNGGIIVWHTGQPKTKQLVVIAGYGYPATSLSIWKDIIISAYGSGHIRLFSLLKGQLVAEVLAHGKWINAIDVAKDSGLMLSGGEDGFVRVWTLSPHHPQIEHKHNEHIASVQVHGVQFISAQGKAFGCTGFDMSEIIIFMNV